MKTTYTLLLLAAMIGFTACNRDDDGDQTVTPAGFDTEDLLEGTWQLSAVTVDPAFDMDQDGTAESDVLATYPECRRDNLFLFTEGNTYEERESETACSGNEPGQELEDGVYVISPDENDLTVTIGSDVEHYEIVSVDENTLVLQDSFEEDDVDYTVRRTYTRQ